MEAAEVDWSEIKRACCETAEAVTQIADRFGVSRYEIYKRRNLEQWPMPNRRKPPLKRATWRGRASVKRRAKESETLVERLRRLAMRNLEFLEQTMDSEEGLTMAEQDRATKAIVSTTKVVEKLKEVEAAYGRSAPDGANPRILNAAEIERMRLEIAERLERVCGLKPAEGRTR